MILFSSLIVLSRMLEYLQERMSDSHKNDVPNNRKVEKMMKRLMTVFLAMCLELALCVPALADTEGADMTGKR